MRQLPWVVVIGSLFLLGAGKPQYKTMKVKVTAYCPCKKCCGKGAKGKTATGRRASLAGVAVDPKVIPLGAHLDIPNYTRGPNNNGSWIKADDTGSKVQGKHIDVRFDTHQEALDWAAANPELTVRIWE